jgi:type II secretory pathway pseudopilin PulG
MAPAIKGQRRGSAGFTLVEVWISMGLVVLVFATVASFSFYMARSFAGLGNYLDMERSSQTAMDALTRDIRQSYGLASWTATEIVLKADTNGTPLTYRYSPDDQTLSRLWNGASDVVLTSVRSLSFSNYQRNPIPGTFDQYALATSPAEAKLISVTWVRARQLYRSATNSESIQTAKIVIRKKQ